jgi:hypothetical protein
MRSRLVVISGAVFTMLALVLASPVEALINVNNTVHTGVFSISSGQTVRVHAQHVPGQQAKCQVEVSFFRAGQGVLVGGPTLLTPGGDNAEFAEYTAGSNQRLRAEVALVSPTPVPANGSCIVSAEVMNPSGQTLFMIGDAVQFAIEIAP